MVDVRFALRAIRRAPQFAALVIGTMALGIGANTSIFSVVHALVLRPLPYARPEQLVRITSELQAHGADDTGVAPLELFDYQSRSDLFSAVAGLYPVDANLTGGDQPERVEVMLVSPNYFSILGIAPQLGRVLGAEDTGPGISEVVVVSDRYWKRRLGGAPDALGRKLMIDDDPYVLVGVMPEGFRHPGATADADVDVWAPAGYKAMPFGTPTRTARFLAGALARLQPGVTVGQAQAALAAYADGAREQFPNDYPARDGWAPVIVPLHEDVSARDATTLWILLGAVGLLLLIACANVANLFLARASERRKEIAMRMALGASRFRLAKQMLIESAVLMTIAGALGLLVASLAGEALLALAPGRIAARADFSMNTAAVIAAVVLSFVTAVVFGITPLLQVRVLSALASVRGVGGSQEQTRVRHALVSGEVALAIVLLVCAGLLTRTVTGLLTVPLGFEPANLLTARVWLPRPNDADRGVYLRPETRAAFVRETLRRLEVLPGVEQVAMSNQIPLGGYNPPLFVEIESRAADGARPVIHNFQVSPGYFETMRIPLLRGRGFSEFDRAGNQPVAIVSTAAAAAFWNSEDPIGKRVRLAPNAPWTTIVGIAGDVQHRRLDEPPQPILYRPLEQSSNLTLAILVRAAGEQPGLAEAIRREVRAVDANLPVYSVHTAEELLAASLGQREFLMRIVSGFGAAAIGLAMLGLYSVLSYSVAQRTREIGIRVAVGAGRGDLTRLVLGQGMRLTAVGMLVGVLGASAVSRLVQSELHGVSRFDPATIIAVLLIIGITALVSVAVPARRATRVDPVVALSAE